MRGGCRERAPTPSRTERHALTRHLLGTRLAVGLLATGLLAGCGSADRTPPAGVAAEPARPADLLPVPDALTDGAVGLREAPVAVPLELRLPTLGVAAPVLGVGMTATDVMDAPVGPAADPVWQQAFWYRGSAVPGTSSTAVIAGHVNDPLGRDALFAHIDALRPGDPIVVHDTRSGLDVRFSFVASESYTLTQATDPAVLARIYGAGPVAGTAPQPSVDGLSHLTLITCAGTFRDGTHDHRLAVYATRLA